MHCTYRNFSPPHSKGVGKSGLQADPEKNKIFIIGKVFPQLSYITNILSIIMF